MDFAEYFEQIYDLGRYLLSQSDLPDLSKYYSLIFIGMTFLVVLFVISKIIARRKAVREYLEDGICLKLEFPPMSNREEKLKNILDILHKELYSVHKNKYYFSLEILVQEKNNHMFLFLPRVEYANLVDHLAKECDLKEVSEQREKFIDSLKANIICMKLELSGDFVYPLVLKKGEKPFCDYMEKEEWFFLQILCRPIGDNWLRILDRFTNELQKGKEPSGRLGGCFGGCLGVTLPFFTFLGDIITLMFHGSRVGGRIDTDKTTISEVNRKKLDLINLKRDSYGFETLVRVCLKAVDKDRDYLLSDKFLDFVTYEEGEGNSFVIAEVHKKIRGDFKNELLLANMGKFSVDILTVREIITLFAQFV